MRTLTLALAVCFAPVAVGAPQETIEDVAIEAYESALDAWQTAQQEHRNAYRNAEGREEQMRVMKEERPDPDAFAVAFSKICRIPAKSL